jgi:hypothetical protein
MKHPITFEQAMERHPITVAKVMMKIQCGTSTVKDDDRETFKWWYESCIEVLDSGSLEKVLMTAALDPKGDIQKKAKIHTVLYASKARGKACSELADGWVMPPEVAKYYGRSVR